MALPKVYTTTTTIVTKTISFVVKHAPKIGVAIGIGIIVSLMK